MPTRIGLGYGILLAATALLWLTMMLVIEDLLVICDGFPSSADREISSPPVALQACGWKSHGSKHDAVRCPYTTQHGFIREVSFPARTTVYVPLLNAILHVVSVSKSVGNRSPFSEQVPNLLGWAFLPDHLTAIKTNLRLFVANVGREASPKRHRTTMVSSMGVCCVCQRKILKDHLSFTYEARNQARRNE